ncbi:MAG: ORF6N domain-containing protein [Bacilli bacterium]|nr:ORF6N domain-containing protein [Bacilli bacterium]
MNKIIEKEEIKVENMIYEIRGKQVMFDSDVAMLFGYETKYLNRQVQRNINRFPDNYCFQLTEEENKNLRCQFVTSSSNTNYGGRRYTPYVFTEYGITMLAGILKSDTAVEMSLKIVNTFITMRKYINNNFLEQNYINKLVLEDHERINLLEESFNKLEEKTKLNSLFFEGQIYDAYSLLIDILNESNEEIIIIDNYAGKELLDILKEINKNIIIISKNINEKLEKKYLSQYQNITFINNDSFHDRFIIIDRQFLYHSGSSFKDLGKKCFAINKIEDINILNDLIEEIINYE